MAAIDVLYASASNLRHKVEVDYMDEDVNFNDLGFLRRNNYGRLRYVLLYNQQRLSDFVTNYRTTLVWCSNTTLTEDNQ